jgi:hypothetical protein
MRFDMQLLPHLSSMYEILSCTSWDVALFYFGASPSHSFVNNVDRLHLNEEEELLLLLLAI